MSLLDHPNGLYRVTLCKVPAADILACMDLFEQAVESLVHTPIEYSTPPGKVQFTLHLKAGVVNTQIDPHLNTLMAKLRLPREAVS